MPVNGVVDQATRIAIIADRARGLHYRELAKLYKRDMSTIHRIVKNHNGLAKSNPEEDYRQQMKHRAIRAVTRGLDCDDDAYKQAGVGVSVLKGLGEFQGGLMVGVQLQIGVPGDWSQRYSQPALQEPE